MSMDETYVVICRDDRRSEDDPPGDYILATREVFGSQAAADAYARSVARSREPLVVAGRWYQLRHGFEEAFSPEFRARLMSDRKTAALEGIEKHLKTLIAHYEAARADK